MLIVLWPVVRRGSRIIRKQLEYSGGLTFHFQLGGKREAGALAKG